MAAYSDQRLGRISQTGNGSGDALPSGSCNYRDLAIGVQAPVCGCKRFWLNNDHYGGHVVDAPASHGREVEQAAHQSTPQRQPAGLGIQAPQSIDTRLFNALNAFARNQDDGPPSDGSSKLPSTACPSIASERRPSPSRVMFERSQYLRPMAPPVLIPPGEAQAGSADEYSATEVATPSIRGTPDIHGPVAIGSQARISPFRFPTVPSQLMGTNKAAEEPSSSQRHPVPGPSHTTPFSPLSYIQTVQPSVVDMENVLRTLSRRVEVLEGMSFSQVPVEEVHERFENMDTRVLDLEVWRNYAESIQAEQQSAEASQPKRRRLLPSEDSSFSSEGSAFDSAAAAHTEAAVLATIAANAETVPRIDALERRVIDLESASLPSFTRPWHVQVVLLPWGRALSGIWFSAIDATQQSVKASTQMSEEWTMPQTNAKLSFTSATSGAWTTESIQAWAKEAQSWLSPKACGPSGTVFQRLESRGFVQDITITASDSGHILSAIKAAFDTVLLNDKENECTDADTHALNERFIPLRKIRKSTRLRFLSPAEMVTSATWTAGFLDDSVCMKVTDGQRRLYLTTPEAYLQKQEEGWAWPQLRQLPMYDAVADEHIAQATSAAIEACWTYNDRLDQRISAAASFAASQSSERLPEGMTVITTTVPQLVSEQNEVDTARDEQNASPTRRQRTVSLPASCSITEDIRIPMPKRRVASFETTSSTALRETQLLDTMAIKRRRISISPEAERKGVGLTPRPSREPPSPFISELEHAGDLYSHGGTSSSLRHQRGATPFAYATPHSNSNYVSGRAEQFPFQTLSCGDTEADTDMQTVPMSDGIDDGDEWQGVGEAGELTLNTDADANFDDHDPSDADEEDELDEQRP
ncbi:hypothetical protein LTR78_005603 [Recurvomyces mirabilis]|uniref:Uncharacterized protein n=1 Tax=Recurvomyces mirabilis TaxID=574656 RepID=A0AAE1C1J1_9PEZI|nr:hypothetical protein LTR78_005603 [Recurvomyces mirabilis]